MSFLLASDLATKTRRWIATKTDGTQHDTPLTAIQVASWGRRS